MRENTHTHLETHDVPTFIRGASRVEGTTTMKKKMTIPVLLGPTMQKLHNYTL